MNLEGLNMLFQKMILFIMPWLTDSKIWGFEVDEFCKFLLSQHLFYILIVNISWTVDQTFVNDIIFWKSLMRTFRGIYANCFNRLRFFAEISRNCKKCTLLDKLRTINSGEGNMETRKMIQFFHLLFSALTVYNIHFCIWK